MHDLPTMYRRVLDILTAAAPELFPHGGNARRYPAPPKLSDLEVVALATTAEALEIDSERLLYAKLGDYPGLFGDPGHRASFNRRRRRLHRLIDQANARLAAWIEEPQEALVTDSMPIETVRITRANASKACRRPDRDALCADKTYHASTRRWICGYKLHAIFTASGVYVDHVLRPASRHDLPVLVELATSALEMPIDETLRSRLRDALLLGDKGYVSKSAQLTFFDAFGADLRAIPRANARDWKPWPPAWKRARAGIETVFSQLVDEVKIKLNRAKRYAGLRTRVATKLLVRTVKQFVNFHTGHPINQTKHCWAALIQ